MRLNAVARIIFWTSVGLFVLSFALIAGAEVFGTSSEGVGKVVDAAGVVVLGFSVSALALAGLVGVAALARGDRGASPAPISSD